MHLLYVVPGIWYVAVSHIMPSCLVSFVSCFFMVQTERHVDLPCDSKSSPQGQQDLAPSSALEIVDMLQGEGYADGEPEVCLRGGKLFAPRLEEGR